VPLRIHHALFLGFASLVALFVLVALPTVGTGLRTNLTAVYREELVREMGLIQEIIRTRGDADLRTVIGDISERTGYRVTLIAEDGRVIQDSDVPTGRLSGVENHGARPEVVGAWLGETSFTERMSLTVGRPLLYGAMVSDLDGEAVVLRVAASLGEINTSVRDARRVVQGAALIALLVALLLSYGLSFLLARPVVSIVSRARELSSGDLSVRVGGGQRLREVRELASAFDSLADSLAARIEELSLERDEIQTLIDRMDEGVLALDAQGRVLKSNRAASVLFREGEESVGAPITELVSDDRLKKLLNEALIGPVKSRTLTSGEKEYLLSSSHVEGGTVLVTMLDVTEIRRLERVRKDFVANASHEMKTPLTAIRGFAETLAEGDHPPDVQRTFLESIHHNTIRLQRLVDDLLDLSGLEGGRWSAERDVVDLEIVVWEAWSPFAKKAEEKGIGFEVEGEARVIADNDGLFQIFRNLYENALRYSSAGGTIRVEIRPQEGFAHVGVSDSGSGIPPNALPRIFERFYRADPARSRADGGTGLGLAIVRHLVLAMEGEVWAESDEGVGTTIRLTLPILDSSTGS
jgi:two-component system phosphate regulon sensor histidine kinase PhoR